jgi:hypothetical protein
VREALERGLVPTGEQCPWTKLTEADALWIRAQTGMTHRAMADILGVNRKTVGDVVQEKTWRHLL